MHVRAVHRLDTGLCRVEVHTLKRFNLYDTDDTHRDIPDSTVGIKRRSFMLGMPGALMGGSLLAALPAQGNAADASAGDQAETVKIPERPWKVAFEEHYMTPHFARAVRGDTKVTGETGVYADLLEVDSKRIETMDRAGIQYAILSLNTPGIQGEADPVTAVRDAQFANDELRRIVDRHPDRFGGFAALPMQDPSAAANELERAVRELGFHAPLVNSFSNVNTDETVTYLDEPQFLPFWERVQDLGVPLYLHPRNPLPSQQLMFRDHPELLAATWAYLVESSTHALRLITSGLFDRFPDLQICLGHLGEALPFLAWRVTAVYARHAHRIKLKQDIAGYLKSNFRYTTSGFFDTDATVEVMDRVGLDRVYFSTDYPWMDMIQGGTWLDTAQLSDADRWRIGRTNAIELFKLKLAPVA
jgi:2,3-dihydroxybenzoate decarboxylase